MKIPQKWQVFDEPVVLPSKDAERLMPYLVGWTRLADLLKNINESDLMRLVILELLTKQRRKILDRLLMRIGRVQRKRIEERIAKCLPTKRSKSSSKSKSSSGTGRSTATRSNRR